MTPLLYIGHSDRIERELYHITLAGFEGLPERLELPSRHFVCLVACDATSVDSWALKKFAQSLVKSGCVYFCAWGQDCERVHDIFDSARDPDAPVIMTTWHNEDSLDEALWFFVSDTHPDEGYGPDCGCGVAISIGNAAWEEHIRGRLADIEGFRKIILGEA